MSEGGLGGFDPKPYLEAEAKVARTKRRVGCVAMLLIGAAALVGAWLVWGSPEHAAVLRDTAVVEQASELVGEVWPDEDRFTAEQVLAVVADAGWRRQGPPDFVETDERRRLVQRFERDGHRIEVHVQRFEDHAAARESLAGRDASRRGVRLDHLVAEVRAREGATDDDLAGLTLLLESYRKQRESGHAPRVY